MKPNLIDYLIGTVLKQADLPFHGILTALIKRADSDNLMKLELLWPEEVDTIRKRYNSPFAILDDEVAAGETQEQTFQNKENYYDRARAIALRYLSNVNLA